MAAANQNHGSGPMVACPKCGNSEWLPLAGAFSGWDYEISRDGQVRYVGGYRKYLTGKIKKQHVGNSGYLFVRIFKAGERPRNANVHVLVATAFLGPKPDGHEVNRLDGNKQSNAAENLKWTSRSENAIHAVDTGLMPRHGTDNPNSKFSDEFVQEIRSRYVPRQKGITQGNVSALAAELGIPKATIFAIVSERRRPTLGERERRRGRGPGSDNRIHRHARGYR